MSYLEELLPEFRKGAKIRCSDWSKESFIYYDEDVIRDECNCLIFTEVADYTDSLLSDKWELYQEPIDYDYIIKNKCLCSFWDDENLKCLGLLTRFPQKKDLFPYKTNTYDGSKYFKHCRPVCRDEVTFYEDRKDD